MKKAMSKTRQMWWALLICKLFLCMVILCIVVTIAVIARGGEGSSHTNVIELSPTLRWIVGFLIAILINICVFVLRHELDITRLKNHPPTVLQSSCDKTVEMIYKELGHGVERFDRIEKSIADSQQQNSVGHDKIIEEIRKITVG
jgi:hypothetical protein